MYHGSFTQETFWEEKFIPVNMKSFGRCNVRKHRDIKNGEKYIILDISSNLDCLYKRKVTSSESNDYMGIPGKSMTTSMAVRTENPNNEQKERFAITDSIGSFPGGLRINLI